MEFTIYYVNKQILNTFLYENYIKKLNLSFNPLIFLILSLYY